MPYTGPVTGFSTLGKGEVAYFKMLNDQGGVNGRKINLISLDDGYAPPRTVEQTRRLVEQDGVAFIFGSTRHRDQYGNRSAISTSARSRSCFIGSGAYKFGNYKETPWTMAGSRLRSGPRRAFTRGTSLRKSRNAQDRNPLPERRLRSRLRGGRKGRAWRPIRRDRQGSDLRIHRRQPSIRRSTSLQGSGANALIVAATPEVRSPVHPQGL